LLSSIHYFNVQSAENGKEAYKKITEKIPDILITDVKMPEMSGDELLEKLVGDQIKIPTIVTSSQLDSPQGIRAIFYSHRMYTEYQIERLQLPIQSTIEEHDKYISQKMRERQAIINQRIVLSRSRPYVPKDFGFTAIETLDIDQHNQLVDRIKTILHVVYGIDANP